MNSRDRMIAELRAAQITNRPTVLTCQEVTDVLNVFEAFCEPPKPPAWVVTWTLPRGFHIADGTSTLTSWPAVLDYIERIVPRGATFTVKPA